MTARYLLYEKNGAVGTITLKRPRVANRISQGVVSELTDACFAFDADTELRVLVITGFGGSFSAGWEPIHRGKPLVLATPPVANVRKPVIAAINGNCLDQGLELALACDFRVATEGAFLGLRQVANGLVPWDGGTQRLPRVVGIPQAMRLLLTGETIDAKEALRIGLVNEVVDRVDLEISIARLTGQLLDAAPIALSYAKEASLASMDLSLAQGLTLEMDLNLMLQGTHDRAEGLRSFFSKRKPRYKRK